MNSGMKMVTVIPLKKGSWKETLTYFSSQDIQNGSIVCVPFQSKKILGLVVECEDVSRSKGDIKGMSFNLKKITEVKEHSIFRREYLDSAIETSKYFVANKNDAITSLIPAVVRENYDAVVKSIVSEATPNMLGVASLRELKSEKILFQAPIEERMSAYKTLIRSSFVGKKSVFIVLPTEHDIKMFEESLSKGIEQFTFAFHGGISPKKMIEKFTLAMNDPHPVLILGTGMFLSIPREDLGTIIVEHESSSAYKMIARPHFDLKLFVELFATKINAKLILGDTLLRYETIARVDLDGFTSLHPLSYRINFDGHIEILDKTPLDQKEVKKEKFKILEDNAVKQIKKAISKKESVFIFTLRKGLATMTVCRDCGEAVSCTKCGAPLVLYLSHRGQKKMFVCNRCQRDTSGETVCASCGSWNLMPLGIGTDTVSEEIKRFFPKIKVFQLDKESAKTSKGAEKIIDEFEDSPGSILIGTEMAFFYLKNKVPLSVIASFDSLWSIPSFRMSEKIIQIILFLSEITSERLVIQTKNKKDPVIQAVTSENLLSLVREELLERKNLGYPPYKRFIKITHLGDKEETSRARGVLEEMFREYAPEIFSGFVPRLKDNYVTNALIKMDPKKWSLPEISTDSSIDENLYTKLSSLSPNFEVLVDPEDLL